MELALALIFTGLLGLTLVSGVICYDFCRGVVFPLREWRFYVCALMVCLGVLSIFLFGNMMIE